MSMFTFEINGYCFYFECETWNQFEKALDECDILPDEGTTGKMVTSIETEES